MRIIACLLAASAVTVSLSAPAGADVRVTFEHPERFTDASLSGGLATHPDAAVLTGVASQLQRLGGAYLPPGQNLTVTVLDIDLAGQYEPWQMGASHVRFMRGVTWPKMKVRWTLANRGKVIARGDETISDQTYQMSAAGLSSSDPLKYEKNMLDDWFRDRFVRARR
jgi:hypothetical protein